MRLLMRTTVIALFFTLLSVFALGMFATRVMRVSVPPQEFSAWPTAKKETWLYEHKHPAIAGLDLIKTWARAPSQALPYVSGEAEIAFALAWFASLLGGLWQMHGRDNNSNQRTQARYAGSRR